MWNLPLRILLFYYQRNQEIVIAKEWKTNYKANVVFKLERISKFNEVLMKNIVGINATEFFWIFLT